LRCSLKERSLNFPHGLPQVSSGMTGVSACYAGSASVTAANHAGRESSGRSGLCLILLNCCGDLTQHKIAKPVGRGKARAIPSAGDTAAQFRGTLKLRPFDL
jgi:hypothetical protein